MKPRTILLAAALICAGMMAQAQINPTFNPEKGAKYTYREVNDQKMTQSVGGQDLAMTNVIERLIEINVKEKDNNEVTLDYTIKEIVVTASSVMMSFKVDTKNKAANTSDIEKLIASIYDCIIGKPLQFIVAPDGAVKSTTGYNAIMEDITKVLANLGEMEQQTANGIMQAFSEDAIKIGFEQTFKIYPGKEIKIGDSWKTDISFEIATINTNINSTLTLKSVSNDIALVDVAAITSMKPSVGMEGEGKGEQKGDLKFNVKTGMLVQSTYEGSTKGKFSTQGMEVSMDIVTKTSYTLQQ